MKATSIALTALLGMLCSPLSATTKPNIIFILADDLGYMDVAAYAAKVLGVERSACYYETPNIDKLSDQGVSFSQAYVNQLCSPSRTALLTGRYHCRVGMTTAWFDAIPNAYNQGTKPPAGYHPLDADHADTIKSQQAWRNAKVIHAIPSGQPMDKGWNEVCIPEVLTAYESAFIGKWHSGGGGDVGYQPQDQGFRTLAHLDSGGCRYFNWRSLWAPGAWKPSPRFKALWDTPRNQGSYSGPEPEADRYLTDALTDTAVAYIKERANVPDKPFLLYFSHFSVHTPLEARKADIEHFTGKATRGWNGQCDPVYAAMVKALDDSVGRLMAALKETGLIEKSVVVFISDNGGLSGKTSNAPLRDGKAFLYEGGVRVPLIIWSPARITRLTWCDVPVHAVDILPTLAELAGEKVKHRIDGQSLLPLLSDTPNEKKRYVAKPIYWHYPFNVGLDDPATGLPLTPHSAMRKGDYKLIWDWHGKLELYNIGQDVSERVDLSAKEPERAKELFAELVSWLDANVERRYFPVRNPEYQPEKDTRNYPFRDLRKELLGLTSLPGLPDAMGVNAGRP
jgi:arylsulfatase A-like enzyme